MIDIAVLYVVVSFTNCHDLQLSLHGCHKKARDSERDHYFAKCSVLIRVDLEAMMGHISLMNLLAI